jgi:hypothetical protein
MLIAVKSLAILKIINICIKITISEMVWQVLNDMDLISKFVIVDKNKGIRR